VGTVVAAVVAVVAVVVGIVVVVVAADIVPILVIALITALVVFIIHMGAVNQKTVQLVGRDAIIVSQYLLHRDVKPTVIIVTPVDCVAKASCKVYNLST